LRLSFPTHSRFFGANNDRMPAFGADKKLSDSEVGLLADWLRGAWQRTEK